jgi:hypothetical protein
VAECAAAFNAVHDDLVWFAGRTPPGAERDNLDALLKPLDDLLARHQPVASTQPAPEVPAEPGSGASQPS